MKNKNKTLRNKHACVTHIGSPPQANVTSTQKAAPFRNVHLLNAPRILGRSVGARATSPILFSSFALFVSNSSILLRFHQQSQICFCQFDFAAHAPLVFLDHWKVEFFANRQVIVNLLKATKLILQQKKISYGSAQVRSRDADAVLQPTFKVPASVSDKNDLPI